MHSSGLSIHALLRLSAPLSRRHGREGRFRRAAVLHGGPGNLLAPHAPHPMYSAAHPRPYSIVKVYDGTTPLNPTSTVTAAANGTWSLTQDEYADQDDLHIHGNGQRWGRQYGTRPRRDALWRNQQGQAHRRSTQGRPDRRDRRRC